MKRAAEEEVGKTPERIENGVVYKVAFEVVFDRVQVVDGDHDRHPDAAVEQVNYTEALDTDVGHCLQGSLTP